jgi:hypothetical protein
MVRGLVFLAVAAGLAGCGEDDRPAEWSYIHAAIIEPSCTTSACHTKLNDLANTELYDAEVACDEMQGLVRPGDPGGSYLIWLLRNRNLGDFPRMPPDRPLPQPDIELIERWIEEGAECD